jgi:hypothetical protein
VTDYFSRETLEKAHLMLRTSESHVEPDPDHRNIWWVVPRTNVKYRVQTDYDPATKRLTWVTCTCPHGLHAGGGMAKCYHAAAVFILIRQDVDENPSPPNLKLIRGEG